MYYGILESHDHAVDTLNYEHTKSRIILNDRCQSHLPNQLHDKNETSKSSQQLMNPACGDRASHRDWWIYYYDFKS